MLRRAWKYGRWALVAILLPLVIAVHVACVLVVVWPFDRDELVATSAPLVILDARGDQIAVLPAVGADRTTWTPLGEIPAIAVSSVIESEDDRFWDHGGVDALGIARAMWLDVQGGRFGGSTLTMQLARMLATAGEARTLSAKLRESLLALRIERAVDKRTILEQWMNRAYFGNGASGFAAAAQLYFGKPPGGLSDAEATLLAVLPRAPSGYDPYTHMDAALRRRDRVLALLALRGVITEQRALEARMQVVTIGKHVPVDEAPHFTRWIAAQLPPEVRYAGGTLRTTLDLRLQKQLQQRVHEQVAQLARKNLDQAGLVVLDAHTSEVRVMIGSAAWDGPDGQINITTRRRHPGSALKPFVYAAAIERGDNPATIAWDTRDTSDDYFAPSSGVEHGPVRYREALASSYNFAAVDVLQKVGVTRVMSMLRTAGVAELEGVPDDYGLRLALGSAKVRLVDLTAGYGFLVKDGFAGRPRGIAVAVSPDGARWSPPRVPERRVVSPETAWLVMDMLSDPEARRPGFGMELPFDLPFPIAAKTGTARGFSDTWAVGATQEVLVGAWAGTFDDTSTQGLVGMDAAAPLVRDAMLAISQSSRLTLPPRPAAIEAIELCAGSGLRPSAACPRISDYVVRGRAAEIPVDTWYDDAGAIHYPERAAGWLRRRSQLGAKP